VRALHPGLDYDDLDMTKAREYIEDLERCDQMY
jgi:hypothetical protein